MSYAAAALGWQTRLLLAAADDAVASLLGLDRSADFESAEMEAPDALLWLGDPGARPDLALLLDSLGNASWHGRANRLSREHVRWPEIDSIHRITHKPLTEESTTPVAVALPPPAAPALDVSSPRSQDAAAAPWISTARRVSLLSLCSPCWRA